MRIVSSRQSVQYKTNHSYPDASTVLDETDEEYREEEYRLGPKMRSLYVEFGISGHNQDWKISFVSKKSVKLKIILFFMSVMVLGALLLAYFKGLYPDKL